MQTLTTAIIGSGLAFLVTSGLVLFPEQETPQPFMTVHQITQDEAGTITPDRTVYFSATADWMVTVVGPSGDEPVCQTLRGPILHQGWSDYHPNTKSNPMPLDVWVGDAGCWDRLEPGDYTEYVTWTPRDGSLPVAYQREFTKG